MSQFLSIPRLDGDERTRDALTHQSASNSAGSVVRRSVMSEKLFSEAQPVSFGARLANSQAFANLFRDGMALVEETATYLDGPGRSESKKLERAAALAYATESMRLTTRLMQLASWLLLHRAVKEGEMSLAQASKEKNKVKIAPTDTHDQTNVELLPIALQDLIARSLKLQGLVRRLDTTIHNRVPIEQPLPINPVERQIGCSRRHLAPKALKAPRFISVRQ